MVKFREKFMENVSYHVLRAGSIPALDCYFKLRSDEIVTEKF